MYIRRCICICMHMFVRRDIDDGQAPRSRQPCSSCRRRGGRLRCARFVSATNGYEIVTDTRIAITLVDLVIK